MKTKQQSKFILRLLAVTLFTSVSSTVFSQEYIRGSEHYLLTDTSIVRTIGVDSVILYNSYNTSSFMIVTPGATSINTWYIKPVFVNDFEVVGKSVYFCGYKLEDNVKKAVFGSFNLNYFAADTLQYYVLDSCTELKKLDHYLYTEGLTYWERHLVMTGTTGGRSDVLAHTVIGATVPASPLPPFTFSGCDVYFSDNEDENFDDVAVTDNYVVVSTRTKKQGMPLIDFMQFELPTFASASVLYSNIKHLMLWSPDAETPVFLEHVTLDSYAAVYKVNGYSKMAMLLLNAPITLNGSVEIFGDENQTIVPIDIKFNKKSYVFDILARNERYRDNPDLMSVPMQIYHVTPNVINNLVTYGDGTKYTNKFYYLWSIDPLKESIFFVASGGAAELTRLFKYRHNNWSPCPVHFEYRFDLGKPFINNTEDKLKKSKWFEHDKRTIETHTDYVDFNLKCGHE